LAQLQQQHGLMQKAYKLGELSLNELLLHSQQLVDARGRIDRQAKIDYAESLSLLLLNHINYGLYMRIIRQSKI
jgi:hypothetical protein